MPDFKKRKELASRYSDDYHRQFNDLVKDQIRQGKNVLILGIHSYSDLLTNSLGKKGPYPDICIGVSDGTYSYFATYSLEHKTIFAFKCNQIPLFEDPSSSYALSDTASGFFSINEADTQYIFNYFDNL